MTNLNDPENDGRSKFGEFPVVASVFSKEGEYLDTEIGTVFLLLDLAYADFPAELCIDGVTYVKE